MADKVVIDCSKRTEERKPLTAAEQTERAAMAAQATQERQVEAARTGNADMIRRRLVAVIGQADNAVANWSTLTPPQKDAVQKAAVQAVAGLARLILNRLDSAGS